MNDPNYGVDRIQGAHFSVSKLESMLADIHERSTGVTIVQLGYGEFIQRYDRPGMLFYLDPPYWGCETDYGRDVFGRADFEQLAAQLAGVKGTCVLSIDDTSCARAEFARFHLAVVATPYTVGSGAGRPVREFIFSNTPDLAI